MKQNMEGIKKKAELINYLNDNNTNMIKLLWIKEINKEKCMKKLID